MARAFDLTAAFEVGDYWSKDIQIDVVGLRDDGWTDLGECKWGPVRSARAAEFMILTAPRIRYGSRVGEREKAP